jgi:DNA-binding SARP family transcriptional activator
MAEAPLTIHLFGLLKVRLRGEPLPHVRSRTVSWTLALLALRHGRAVEREWLAGTLWPDSTARWAYQNLRRCLSELRHALGPEAWRIATPNRHAVSLDLSGAEVDLVSFDEAIQGADAESLARAIALYGGPLLEGCTEEWVLPEREAREQAYLGVLERLALESLNAGDPAAAVPYLRRAVAVDPLRESAQRLLLEALAAAGEYGEAVQSYRALRLLLWEELRMEPSPETRAVYEQIRAQARDHTARDASRAKPRARPLAAPAGPLPPIWNVPHRRNPSFAGREGLLAGIEAVLAADGHAALTQAIVGLGGIGKTQCALEYAYRHAEDYQIIWWVRAEEPAQLLADYAALAVPLDLVEKQAPDQSATAAAVRRWLERRARWLLIFDNASDPQAVLEYLPRAGEGHILITSRDQNWGRTAATVPVPVLPQEEAVALLQQRTGWSGPEVGVVAEELGQLPLALEQAAAYAAATGCSVTTYLGLLRSRRRELLQHGAPLEGYRGTVATTWSLSMAEVAAQCPAAAQLLNLCAYLAPDGIPLSLIREGAEFYPEALASAARDPVLLHEALAALRRYSLVTVHEEALTVHRLVQAVVRDGLTEEEQRQWAAAAVRLVYSGFPEYAESNIISAWPKCALLVPHALPATELAMALEAAPVEAGRLLSRVGCYLQDTGDWDQGEVCLRRAVSFVERALGPDHAELSDRLADAARQGLADSQALLERALAIAERALGPDHPTVAWRLMSVGLGLRFQITEGLRVESDNVGAKACFERALSIAERAEGPDGALVGEALAHLASALTVLGDLERAQACAERALAIAQRVYQSGHLSLANRHWKLGLVLAARGDFAGQKAQYERVLALRGNGPGLVGVGPRAGALEGGWSTWDLLSMGWATLCLGETAEARVYYERALAAGQEVWGPEHGHNFGALAGLARMLQDVGEPEPAKALLERYLMTLEGSGKHGGLVPFWSLHPLASVLLDLGDLEGAERHLARALTTGAWAKTGLGPWAGPDYEGVVAMLPTLGRLRRLQGRVEEARAALDESLATPEQLGPPHWGRTAATHLEYGLTLQAEGDLAGAREHLTQAVAMFERQIGPRHPRTEKARRALAELEAGVTSKRRRASRPPRAR